MVGDAVGAYVKFMGGNIPDEKIRKALDLPGWGPLAVGPGQVTDDSELMMALLAALVRSSSSSSAALTASVFPADEVAKEYIKWHRSMPFDMGMTFRRAFTFSNGAEAC